MAARCATSRRRSWRIRRSHVERAAKTGSGGGETGGETVSRRLGGLESEIGASKELEVALCRVFSGLRSSSRSISYRISRCSRRRWRGRGRACAMRMRSCEAWLAMSLKL